MAIISIISIAAISLIVVPQVLTSINKVCVGRQYNILNKIAEIQYENSRFVIYFAIILSLISLLFFNKVKFDANLENMNYMSVKSKTAEKIFNDILKIDLSKILIFSKGKDFESALEVNDELGSVLESMKKEGKIGNFSSIGILIYYLKKNRIILKKLIN